MKETSNNDLSQALKTADGHDFMAVTSSREDLLRANFTNEMYIELSWNM